MIIFSIFRFLTRVSNFSINLTSRKRWNTLNLASVNLTVLNKTFLNLKLRNVKWYHAKLIYVCLLHVEFKKRWITRLGITGRKITRHTITRRKMTIRKVTRCRTTHNYWICSYLKWSNHTESQPYFTLLNVHNVIFFTLHDVIKRLFWTCLTWPRLNLVASNLAWRNLAFNQQYLWYYPA